MFCSDISLRSKCFQWARSELIFPAPRELGESKKNIEGGGEERRRKPLLPYPLQFFFCARLNVARPEKEFVSRPLETLATQAIVILN